MKGYFILLAATLLLLPGTVLAGKCPDEVLVKDPNAVCLDNPLAGNKVEATSIIGTLIKGALSVMGSLTLLMMVWGGFQWLTSAGNSEKIDSGKKTMFWAIIGVVVVLTSYIVIDTFTTLLTT